MRRAWHWLIGTWIGRVLLTLIVLLVALRIAAPFVLVHVANNELRDLDGYTGSIDRVSLCLITGSYGVHGIEIIQTDGEVPVPFLTVDAVEADVAWGPLFRGRVVTEVTIHRPVLNFVHGRAEEDTQVGYEDWQETLDELVPTRIDRLTIRDGLIHFRNYETDPKVNLYVQDLWLEVRELATAEEVAEERMATLKMDALVQGSGRLRASGQMDPLASQPRFDLKVELADLDVPKLNDFLQAYVNVDAQDGTIEMIQELHAAGGTWDGYVQPMIRDLEIFEWRAEDKGFLEQVWEGTVGLVAWVLENPSEDQIATRVPVEGSFEDPDIGIWDAIWSLLSNAFIEALTGDFEGLVDVEGLPGAGASGG
jgi:hypothetical protein